MIWIIGGTSDANAIARRVVDSGKAVIISTTTDYGSSLATYPGVTVMQGKMDVPAMEYLCQEEHVSTIIDASHPFAQEVSENAMGVASRADIRYIRFERENQEHADAHYYSTYESLVESLRGKDGNILLTIGSKNLHRFTCLDTSRIIARVLAVPESIKLCQEAAIPGHNIIAMKGKCSMEMNLALMKEYNIKHLVTKDSGKAGGVEEKLYAARELDIETHIVERPDLAYPSVVSNVDNIIELL